MSRRPGYLVKRRASILAVSCILLCLSALTVLASLAQASTFQTLYSFHSPERYPQGGLIRGGDGNFYGTSSSGGPHSAGTVFRVAQNGGTTQLAVFNGKNGSTPVGALVQAPDGNFYGTTSRGGSSGNGTIFRVTPYGILTSLYSFAGTTDGSRPRSALAVGADGNLYGTAFQGGAFGVGTAFNITPSGIFTLLYTFQNGQYPNGLVLGVDGNFHGTTYWGGPGGYGTVFSMTPTGFVTTLYSFSGASDGGNPFSALTIGADGNFYGTTVGVGSGGFGTVFVITPFGNLSTLYTFTGGPDGSYVAAPLLQASDGNFYGISSLGGQNANGNVFRMTPIGALTPLYQFNGFGFSGNTPSLGTYGGLAQGNDGNLYGAVPQFFNSQMVPNDGGVFRITLAGQLKEISSFVAPKGERPVGFALDPDGDLYGSTGSGGPSNNGTLFQLTPQGALTSLLVFNGTNGGSPSTLVRGKDGDFYGTVSAGQSGFGGIFRITAKGKFVWQIALNGTNGGFPFGGLVQGKNGAFYGTTSGGGAFNSGTIFRVSSKGLLNTLYSFTGSADGSGPFTGLTQDSSGNLYGSTFSGGISNAGTLFQITSAGAFKSLYSFTGGTDGTELFKPLTLGDDGNLYGVTFGGGANSVGTVFRITPGGVLNTIYSFAFVNGGGFYPQTGLIKGANGTFYGGTYAGGSGQRGTLYSITTTGTYAAEYSFSGDKDGGPPQDLYPGSGKAFYGTTGGNFDPGTIFSFTP